MSTHEHMEQIEPQSNNGWQNQGMCYKFAKANVPQKLRLVFLEITDSSFGYMQMYTARLSHKEWALRIGISERTFYAHIHELIDIGLVKINVSTKYVENGGSEAFSYSPAFPTGYGKMIFRDKTEQAASGSTEPKPLYDPNGSI